MKEAMFYEKLSSGVQCKLCPRNCMISDGATGFCKVRKNIRGKLYSLVFGKPCSIAIDPIEKKPLFHFAPGSECLSIATVGCNFACKFCQNFQISQPQPQTIDDQRSSYGGGEDMPPEKLIKMNKTPGFAWTYTEPTVFYEYFYETARLSKKMKKDFYHIWVSNGYTNPEPVRKAAWLLDAINVDYKGNAETYKKLCGAALIERVQDALIAYKRAGVWIEITNLIITNHNDSPEKIKEMCQWVSDNLGQVPMHFSRYFPMHKMTEPATPLRTLEKAAEIAEGFFDFVYVGNIRSDKEHTYCPDCKKLLIKRTAFSVEELNLAKKGKDYHCAECSRKIPLAGMEWSPFGEE
jgi:pyruvate formate lyase activating enzyme